MQELALKGDVLGLKRIDQDYELKLKSFESFKYLKELEDVIFRIYEQAIRAPNRAPFIDFEQPQRDAYLRLKLRLLSQTPAA